MKVVEDYGYIPADLRAAGLWAVSISVIVTCQPPSPFCEGAAFFSCVTVLCHQSSVKKQEDIIALAQSFCGRRVQRVMTPLNPQSSGDSRTNMAQAQIYPGDRF